MARRALLLCWALAVVAGCSSPTAGDAREDDYSTHDFAEDTVLPQSSGWLDAPRALSGVGQFDRLKGTVHDDAKCSTMVAMAAAVVGGRERFFSLLDAAERKRQGKREDLATLDRVRSAARDGALTPRLLHELTEVLVRAYEVEAGATDGQISAMIRASGYAIVPVGSKIPRALVEALGPGEVFPLGTVADGVAHVVLVWKDAHGTVRLYDSDDVHGSHVMPRGSKKYADRVDDPQSSWDLAQKYR